MASKSKTIAESQIYNIQTDSTGAFDLQTGTTAQRPSSPTSGNLRFNTDTQSGEIYDGTGWGKVSPLTPTLSSISGNIMNGVATNLTLTGTEFLISNLIVNFTPSGGSTTSVTIQPTTTLFCN